MFLRRKKIRRIRMGGGLRKQFWLPPVSPGKRQERWGSASRITDKGEKRTWHSRGATKEKLLTLSLPPGTRGGKIASPRGEGEPAVVWCLMVAKSSR